MDLRRKLSENRTIMVIACLAAMAMSLWVIMGSRHRVLVGQAYYFDLDDNKLFADDIGQVPPFVAPSGHAIVAAAVFSCADCADASSRFIGYLEKYSDAYRAAMGKPGGLTFEITDQGHLIRSQSGDTWVSSNSTQGREIVGAVEKRCGDQPPKACQP